MKWIAACLMFWGTVAAAASNETELLLAEIAKTGPQGVGAAEAKVARDELAKQGIEILPQLLKAMDTTNPIAANWYRTIYEEIVNRALDKKDTVWPIVDLKTYVSDSKRAGRSRRLVLKLLHQLEPTFQDAWLPTRLDDPEFRFEAVGLALNAGDRALKSKDSVAAKSEFRQAFDAARDSAQVRQAATKLKSLGESADPVVHLGLLVDWWLIGPFDAPEKTGFGTVYEPERNVDLHAKYKGQTGDVVWKRHRETELLGQLDLNQILGTTREAVAYAYLEIEVPQAQAAQLRCGADDNCSVWINKNKVFAREQWLNGIRFDRFVTPIELKAGRNSVLVKICQGPQHKDPEVPNNWSLQVRLCDADGRGISFNVVKGNGP